MVRACTYNIKVSVVNYLVRCESALVVVVGIALISGGSRGNIRAGLKGVLLEGGARALGVRGILRKPALRGARDDRADCCPSSAETQNNQLALVASYFT